MSQPHISRLSIWEKHESRVIDVLLAALEILQIKLGLAPSEIDLNRELYFCLLEANRQQWAMGNGFDHPPISEAKNPPYPDDVQRARRESKIPDFQWGFIDHTILDPRHSARYFVFECKRLGKPPRADWVLNENYFYHGILRFMTEEHGYAKGEKSGAMVGYIQSMDFEDILNEVNIAASVALIPPLTLSKKAWHKQGTYNLEHILTRPFALSPFLLLHFWIDLRNCYITSSTQLLLNRASERDLDQSSSTMN